MKITSIKTAATVGHGMHLWVKVETDAGITGLGECVHGGTQAIAVIEYLEPKLIGKDPFAIDAIFESMRRGHVFDGGTGGALDSARKGPAPTVSEPCSSPASMSISRRRWASR